MICERCKKEYTNELMGTIRDMQGNPHVICKDCYIRMKSQRMNPSGQQQAPFQVKTPTQNISSNNQIPQNQTYGAPQQSTILPMQGYTSVNMGDGTMKSMNEPSIVKPVQFNSEIMKDGSLIGKLSKINKKTIIIVISAIAVLIAGIIIYSIVRENIIGQAEDEVYRCCEKLYENCNGNPNDLIFCGDAKFYGEKDALDGDGIKTDLRFVKLYVRFPNDTTTTNEVYFCTSTAIPTYCGIRDEDTEDHMYLKAIIAELAADLAETARRNSLALQPDQENMFVKYIDTKRMAKKLGVQYMESDNEEDYS